MYPVTLDVAKLPVALAGGGPALRRRLDGLDAANADHVTVYAEKPDAALAAAAGPRLVRHLPTAADLAGVRLLLVAGLDDGAAAALAGLARAMGILVNVEDRKPWCDVHVPAVVRRGDLTLTVSTNGRSPGLARRIRRYLEGLFGPEWQDRVDAVATRRAVWRAEGADMATLGRRTDALIARRRWLNTDDPRVPPD